MGLYSVRVTYPDGFVKRIEEVERALCIPAFLQFRAAQQLELARLTLVEAAIQNKGGTWCPRIQTWQQEAAVQKKRPPHAVITRCSRDVAIQQARRSNVHGWKKAEEVNERIDILHGQIIEERIERWLCERLHFGAGGHFFREVFSVIELHLKKYFSRFSVTQ